MSLGNIGTKFFCTHKWFDNIWLSDFSGQLLHAAYLHQNCEEMFVLWRASTRARILPVKVQSIKSILAQKFYDGSNKNLAVLRCGNHGGKAEKTQRWWQGETSEFKFLALKWFKNKSPGKTYGAVPKFQPPIAKRVFSSLFLVKREKNKHQNNKKVYNFNMIK